MNLGALGKQVGPLPLGVWLLVGGGGLFIAYRKNNTAPAVAPAAGDPLPTGGGDGTVSSWDGAPVVLSPVIQVAPPRVEINNLVPIPQPIIITAPVPVAAPPAPPRVASPAPVANPAPAPVRAVAAPARAASGPAYPGQLIQRGSSGPNVVSVQRVVGVAADGQFGPITQAAVRVWQGTHGLAPDGQVGPLTWAKMFGGR